MERSNFMNIMYDDSTKPNRILYPKVYNVACKDKEEARILLIRLQMNGFEKVYLFGDYKNIVVNFDLKRVAGFIADGVVVTKEEIRISSKKFKKLFADFLKPINAGV